MKKTVRIKESQLDSIIKKVIKEQEQQISTTGPDAEQITGSPESEATPENQGPDFEEFKRCAKGLLGQGVTIGNLVDQLLEAKEAEPEEDENGKPEGNPDTEGGVEPDAPMNEGRKNIKK